MQYAFIEPLRIKTVAGLPQSHIMALPFLSIIEGFYRILWVDHAIEVTFHMA